VLELAILGLLKERAMHGYQLSKRLADTLGAFWKVSYGSLYPALKRLEREGAVESVFPRDEVGRRKNVYRVTEKGEKLFIELLQEAGQESWEDNRFRVRLAFFKYLKPDTRLRLLEKRRAYLEGRLSDIKKSLASTRERIDNYTESLMRHGAEATEQDIAWLDDLIKAERRQVKSEKPVKTVKRVKTVKTERSVSRRRSTVAKERAG
jgi:DNA-binding PadR family transcriptional regulator